ncbi:MAG TPA: hypothetical protein VHF89_16800 [Solirubrobacteraceae bacterium]|nr:hypothetical protein [Solirubrobacteraceae bacterium]
MAGPHAYSAFGVAVRSNRPLSGLAPLRGGATRGGIAVDFVEPPRDAHPAPGGAPVSGTPVERVWALPDGGRLLRYVHPVDGRAWSMRVSAERIEVARDPSFDPAQLAPIVETAGLATALQLGGGLLLHAAAIAVDDGAVLVAGSSGAGKSTTAAAFVARSHRLLSDDLAAIGPDLVVHPGPARLRVTPGGARAVGWDPARLPRLFDAEFIEDKRAVALSAAEGTYCDTGRPLAAIYVLARRPGGGAPAVAALPAREALPLLGASVYRVLSLGRAQHAALFPALARLASAVAVRRVVAGDDVSRVGDVAAAIAADVSSLRRPAPAR